ncbi:MAG: Rid family hydrolase [Bacteroidota bacterium]
MNSKIKNFNPDPTYQIFKPFNLSLSAQAGDFLFLTGQIGANDDGSFPEDFETQLDNVLKHLDRIIKDAGASWNNVVQMRSFHVGDLEEQFPRILKKKAELMPNHQHAWTALGVQQLIPKPSRIEIDLTVYVGK